MSRLPEPLQNVVDRLTQLPGIGPKSALRMAMTILKWPREKGMDLGRMILELRDSLCICGQCNAIADADPCAICTDQRRSEEQLCIVAEWDSILVMEEAGFFRGRYFVLGGLLSPLDGVEPQNLALDKLRQRIGQNCISELILALGTTHEAESTGSYIKNILARDFPGLSVTRLAQGIPLGSELKFIDRETLKQSLEYRQRF
ncbi:MAG: recombination mediator RecR [Desulfovibrionales bacterium]